MNTDYYFGRTDGGNVDGFNDPVSANFSYEGRSLTDSLIREALQNIIDAKLPGVEPVRAEFDMIDVPVSSLPNAEHLVEIFDSCANYAEKMKVIPAIKHYKSQSETLRNNKQIPMLRVSDYNSCGLTGDSENGRWFMFMRGVGFNAGEATAGGAFGLGKGAFFANSLFRTIFVSTVTDEGAKFAGKLRLISFEKDGKLMQGNGTFGLPEQLPIREDIPEIFSRKEKGTDIWVANFIDSADWEDTICRAVLSWFWPSIHWGILTVRVGERSLNADNLESIMLEFFSAEEKKTSKPYNPLHFYNAYTNAENNKVTEFSDILGEVSFYGRTSNDLPFPNKTALIRNTGMIVDFKGRNAHLTKYVAIFECRDKKGSKILRKLENPAHTEWDWHNWKDEYGQYVDEVKNAANEVDLFIAGGLGKLLYAPVSQTTIIPGLMAHIGVPNQEDGSLGTSNAKNQIKEPTHEETGIEIGSEEIDSLSSTHVIKPTRVARYVKVNRNIQPIDRTSDTPTFSQPYMPISQPENINEGISKGLESLDGATIRYIVSKKADKGRKYRFMIRTDIRNTNQIARIRLYSRSDSQGSELLQVLDAQGDEHTEIVKLGEDYCDFSLNKDGSAALSLTLKESWVIALDPTLMFIS